MHLLIRTEFVGRHTKLPRSITAEVISRLLQEVQIIEDEFDESNSIIGYLPDKEENICTYSLRSECYTDSIMSKNIKSGPNDEKQLKHASTEVAYTIEELGTINTYQDIVTFIREQQRLGTIYESVVICCTTQLNNPLAYQAILGGPLDPVKPDPLTTEKNALSESSSCDLIIFGPAYTSLHADFLYSRRSSLIPSWNQGVIKLWIIRKDCSSTTNRYERTSSNRVMGKSYQPYNEIDGVLRRPQEFLLLIQRPGQAIRHNGRHYHCVITAFDPAVNQNMLSMSLGRKDSYTQDKLDYCNAALPTDCIVKRNKKGGTKKVSKRLFIKTSLITLDKTRLKWKDNKKSKSKSKSKSKGGFQKGNQLNPKKKLKVLKHNSDFLYTYFCILMYVYVI